MLWCFSLVGLSFGAMDGNEDLHFMGANMPSCLITNKGSFLEIFLYALDWLHVEDIALNEFGGNICLSFVYMYFLFFAPFVTFLTNNSDNMRYLYQKKKKCLMHLFNNWYNKYLISIPFVEIWSENWIIIIILVLLNWKKVFNYIFF